MKAGRGITAALGREGLVSLGSSYALFLDAECFVCLTPFPEVATQIELVWAPSLG